jgi:L,D-peptidoglycan transpeptidase YkuD (ErfK/YbiS/YcfS/YnhG family)
MKVIVRPDGCKGVLSAGPLSFTCALGRSGVTGNKREGDGASPAGEFPFRRLVFRPDRIGAQELVTSLPAEPLQRDDGWCDDPASSAYNCPVKLPFDGSHEVMWRDDHLYDIVVILGQNDAPPVPGLGSAIFMHLAKEDYAPTEGCVALARTDLLALLARLGPGDSIVIEPEG